MSEGRLGRENAAETRETELDRREAALSAREAALAERMEASQDILIAANRRDAIADDRDTGADTRERHIDRTAFLTPGDPFGEHLPQRRGAALDREHAKGNHTASQDDRIDLTEGPDDPRAARPWWTPRRKTSSSIEVTSHDVV